MNFKRALILLFLPCSLLFAQPCIDSNLINPSIECIALLQPVCGCDGVTYGNPCIAINYYGVTEFSDGPCSIQQPDTCLKIPAGINFGACSSILGWCRIGDECIELSGCSMIGSDGIDYTNYFYGSSYACNSLCMSDTVVFLDCIDSSLINIGVQIPDIYQPVCGCDSVTYQNSSFAIYYHGISNYYEGECVTAAVSNPELSTITVFPNPAIDFITVDNTKSPVVTVKLVQLDGVGFQLLRGTSNKFLIEDIRSGMYLLEIIQENGSVSKVKIQVID
jgi:hypothetical protein